MSRFPGIPDEKDLPPVTSQYLDILNARWSRKRADIVAAALRASLKKETTR
jgi:hypothetical protein